MITLAVILSSTASVQPVRDVASGGDVAEAYLVRGLGYVAIAPISDTLDTLTLLTASQHAALLAAILVIFACRRMLLALGGVTSFKRHALATLVLFGGIFVVYGAAAVLPRPMASLVADNGDILMIDFHSHTSASHDGHQTVEQLREWHRRAGYNLVYVTDHAAVTAAEEGIANNPSPAGNGVTVVQSIEVTWDGEHVGIPGAQRVYKGLLTTNLRDVDTAGLRLSAFVPGREPIVVWHHPRQLDRLKPASENPLGGVRAIEVVNGAPRDADNVRAKRAEILALAQQGGLAMTSGSDNHGFGYVTPGWTLMLIRNWRAATGDPIALEIERVIRTGGYTATRVVERRVAEPGGNFGMRALTIVSVPLRMLTTISNEERVSWLLWTWLVTGGIAWQKRRKSAAVVASGA